MGKIARFGLTSLFVLAVAVGGSALPAAAATAGSSPLRPQGSVTLDSYSGGARVSCGGPRSCLAVGMNFNKPNHPTPMAEAWNGTAWRSVRVPIPKTALNVFTDDVSCSSATRCLVVGAYEPRPGTLGGDQPYAMTWNGTALKPTAALARPKRTLLGSLSDVSCVNATHCVAVGYLVDPLLSIAIETWNGATWTVATPGLGRDVQFANANAVSCRSVTSCVVVGDAIPPTGPNRMLLARWNGKTLTTMKATPPTGARAVITLNDVSCSSADRCVAVGLSTNSGGTSGFGFAEVWDGWSWTAHKVAVPTGDTVAALYGVSCAAGGRCTAVGWAGTAKATRATALSYHGRTWSAQYVPGPGKGKSSDFTEASCPRAGECVAFGQAGASGKPTSTPLAGRWDGRSWRLAAA